MATYYIEVGSGVSGDGTLADPFHIDSQADLDDILDGTYTGSTASVSGDVYIFLDGTYASGLRLNADGRDGITLKGESLHGSHFANALLGPPGDTTGNVLTRSSETTTFENLSVTVPKGAGNRLGGGTVNLINCKVADGSTGSGYGLFQMGGYGPGGVYDGWLPTNITFDRCLFVNSSSLEIFNRRGTNHTVAGANTHPSTFKFDHCTIVSKTTTPIWEGNNGATITIEINNSVIYGEGGTTTDNTNYESFTNSANNWAYQFGNGNLPKVTGGTTDPLFKDPSNEDYRLRPDSPLINKAST